MNELSAADDGARSERGIGLDLRRYIPDASYLRAVEAQRAALA